jgi:hypothetical protein
MQMLRPALNGAKVEITQQLMDSVRAGVVIDPDKLKLIVAALLAGGHVLLEDVPGLAKRWWRRRWRGRCTGRSNGCSVRPTCCRGM